MTDTKFLVITVHDDKGNSIFEDSEGKPVESVRVPKKLFSSGSVGFHLPKKVNIDGKRHQCNLQFVEIGSKPSDRTDEGAQS